MKEGKKERRKEGKRERGLKTSTQQGVRGVFVGLPGDSAGWLFYVPEARRICISLDAVIDEDFTSPISMSDLPFQEAIKLRGIKRHTNMNNSELITEERNRINTWRK